MARLLTPGVLVAAGDPVTVTTPETIIGGEIACGHYDNVTIFIDYTDGTETALAIFPYSISSFGEIAQWQSWDVDPGVKAVTFNNLTITASGIYLLQFDVRATEFVKFTMKATGTPTGTINSASYCMSGA